MNRNLIVLAVLALLIIIPSYSIQFDINNSKYRRGVEFWTVDIPIINFTGSYVINYETLPTGWKTQGNNLLIPVAVTKFSGNYPLKVVVRAGSIVVLRRTLLFKISGSGLFLGDYPYEYTFQANSTGALQNVSSSGTYIKNSQQTSLESSFSRSNQSLRSEYSSLPTMSQLDKIIDSADVVVITKTIQSVIESNLNCQAKLGYLSDFLGRIESYIAIKGFRADDLKSIIEAAKGQISRLETRIKQYTQDIDGLGIPALKIQLNRALARLEAAYAEYNSANVDTAPFELRINNYKSQVTNLQGEITKATNQLTSDRAQITKLDAFILQLQNKLQKARVQRENFRSRVVETQSFLSQSLARVQEVQKLISQTQLKIKNILNTKDKLKTTSTNLEREVDQVKSRIQLSQKRQLEIINKITQIRVQISKEELKLDQSELTSLNEMIKSLEGEVIAVREKIDQIDLQCNGIIDIDIQVLESNEILYNFTPKQFQSYFNGFYGVEAFGNFFSLYQNNLNKNLSLYGYNIFSDKWATQYGRPFANDVEFAFNNGVITNYSFLSDFQCSNYDNLVNIGGKITSIKGNLIEIRDTLGQTYELRLGACSRINGINQYYPIIGNQIACKCALDYDNKYLVHTATFY